MNKIRCYGLSEVLAMKGMKTIDTDQLNELFLELDVGVFQQPITPGSGRGRRERAYYITTNEEFDRWIQLNNTAAILKNLPIAKLKYKKYEEPNVKYNNIWNDLYK